MRFSNPLPAVTALVGCLVAIGAVPVSAQGVPPQANGSAAPGRAKLVPPPAGRIYHAAYPDFRDTEDFVTTGRIRAFENLAGRDIAWAYFSNNWGRQIRFPGRAVRRIAAAGTVPFVRLMARTGWRPSGPDPRYRLQRIIDGDFDSELAAWGRAAARFGRPMLVEFGTEANGSWFPWNGNWNGAGRRDGFGDPRLFDGPERFRAAYRHVREVIESAGATDLTWFFHADDDSWPQTRWNSIAAYYPGDRYVDWIGVSVYGPLTLDEPWRPSFSEAMARVYPKLAALSPSKPIAVLEYGAHQGRQKAGWFRDAMETITSRRFPRLRAASVWSEAWPNGDGTRSNLKIDSDRATLGVYRRFAARPVFSSRVVFRDR
jgi:hypothetical protein